MIGRFQSLIWQNAMSRINKCHPQIMQVSRLSDLLILLNIVSIVALLCFLPQAGKVWVCDDTTLSTKYT